MTQREQRRRMRLRVGRGWLRNHLGVAGEAPATESGADTRRGMETQPREATSLGGPSAQTETEK